MKKKPHQVAEAIARGDRKALSAKGEKGAGQREENRFFQELEEEKFLDDARRHEEEMFRDVPPDDR